MIETIPVFPLPDTVLFPRTHIRLHLFEPRYVALMDRVMAGDEHMGLAHLRPGFESDYFGAPPIYKTLTSARVLLADKLPDGRWNVLLEGIQRVKLVAEYKSEPYRIMKVRPLSDEIPPEHHGESVRLMESAARKVESIAANFEDGERRLTNLVNLHQHPSIVADVIAALTVDDPYTRQSLLEETNAHRRLKLLHVHLDEILTQLRQQGVEINLPHGEAE
ncbi:hypothetical protein GC173_07710 [bacterium]|nr:hypothetical protein [bacterium]